MTICFILKRNPISNPHEALYLSMPSLQRPAHTIGPSVFSKKPSCRLFPLSSTQFRWRWPPLSSEVSGGSTWQHSPCPTTVFKTEQWHSSLGQLLLELAGGSGSMAAGDKQNSVRDMGQILMASAKPQVKLCPRQITADFCIWSLSVMTGSSLMNTRHLSRM